LKKTEKSADSSVSQKVFSNHGIEVFVEYLANNSEIAHFAHREWSCPCTAHGKVRQKIRADHRGLSGSMVQSLLQRVPFLSPPKNWPPLHWQTSKRYGFVRQILVANSFIEKCKIIGTLSFLP